MGELDQNTDQDQPEAASDRNGNRTDPGERSSANALSLKTAAGFLLLSAGLRFLSHPPVQFEFAVWGCLVGYILFFNGTHSWWRLLIGTWIWGFLFYVPSLAWIRHIAYPAWIGLCAIMAGFPVLFATLLRWCGPEPGIRQGIIGGLCWVVTEYVQTHFISGFPYLFLAHSQADLLPLIQIADLTGAWGLSLIIYWFNAALYEWINPWLTTKRNGIPALKSKRNSIYFHAATTAGLVAGSLVYGTYQLQTPPPKTGPKIGVIQGNIPQSVRRRQDPEKTFRTHLKLARKLSGKTSLILWPETMYPYPFLVTKTGSVTTDPPESFRKLTRNNSTDQLIGAHTFKATNKNETSLHNSAWLVSADGKIQQGYFKYHLVPFGEYIPGRDLFPFLDAIVDKVFPFARDVTWLSAGSPPSESEPIRWKNHPFIPLICYEVVFPDEVRTHVNKGANFIVNMSNEAWYRNEAELDQMLAIVRFRSIETRTTVVRATNTGISGFVYPNGRTNLLRNSNGSVRGFRGTLTGRIRQQGDVTLYRKLGDLLPITSIICLILLFTHNLFNVKIQQQN